MEEENKNINEETETPESMETAEEASEVIQEEETETGTDTQAEAGEGEAETPEETAIEEKLFRIGLGYASGGKRAGSNRGRRGCLLFGSGIL